MKKKTQEKERDGKKKKRSASIAHYSAYLTTTQWRSALVRKSDLGGTPTARLHQCRRKIVLRRGLPR